MNAWRVSCVLAAATVIAMLIFVYFSHSADIAMDKTGVGDLELFRHYSRLAGISFWSAAALWVGSVLVAQRAPEPFKGRATLWFGLVQPSLFVAVLAFMVLA